MRRLHRERHVSFIADVYVSLRHDSTIGKYLLKKT
ncbi:hypothetical protein DSUL_50196 [Desulfovibrionales bacterium]